MDETVSGLKSIFAQHGMQHLKSGKTREMFSIPGHKDKMFIYTTNRISVFDAILPFDVPFKAEALNALTVFWLNEVFHDTPNHLVAFGSGIFKYLPEGLRQPPNWALAGRGLVVKKAEVLPVEAIIRGYLTGSGLKDYQRTGKICGHKLPTDLHDGSRLPEPLFTPSTKARLGEHDQNITMTEMTRILGSEALAETIKRESLRIFTEASRIAEARGAVIADTKLEWGLDKNCQLILVDEVLTPDSSRFWPWQAEEYERSPQSLDKQQMRNWYKNRNLEEIPPRTIIEKTKNKYREIVKLLTLRTLEDFQK